ncbi:antirestriction protein [Enterobacter sp. FS01]|nr:antirestriction protein [Enterobacter sp. FS01]
MNQTLTRCDAVRLEGAQRLTFLPDVFGGDFITSEASVYAYASRYCPEYVGGFWHFYRLPDGGGFMAPDVESLTLCNPENWFEQTVSGEVAGIILTALVLNHRSWHHSNHDREELCRHFCRRHEQLMNFIDAHPESATMWRALD